MGWQDKARQTIINKDVDPTLEETLADKLAIPLEYWRSISASPTACPRLSGIYIGAADGMPQTIGDLLSPDYRGLSDAWHMCIRQPGTRFGPPSTRPRSQGLPSTRPRS